MKKITALTTATLLAMSLAACDKAEQKSEPAKPEMSQPAPQEPAQPQQQEAPETNEQSQPAPQQMPPAPTADEQQTAPTDGADHPPMNQPEHQMPGQMPPPSQGSIKISPEKTAQGEADFKKFKDWQQEKEAKLDELAFEIQKQVQESSQSGTVADGLEDNLEQYKAGLADLQKGLQQLNIQDSEVKALADKQGELYALSGQGLALTVKAMTSKDQSEAYMQDFEQKLLALSNQANKVNADIHGAETALMQKYMPKPEQSHQPQTEQSQPAK